MSDRPTSSKAVGLLIAVFVLGGVIGGLGTYMAGRLRDSPRRSRVMDQLTQQVPLTADQQMQIRNILAASRQRYRIIYDQSQQQARPQYEALRADTRARIRKLLNSSQQPKFDEFIRRLDAERKAHEQQNR
ncbi:MAG TPA: hypothetical protein VGS20_01760 [Candidatus Acidoferrales bacterium]|nr:hypothetical protein [Candidatus Acidoferrales bacterium]